MKDIPQQIAKIILFAGVICRLRNVQVLNNANRIRLEGIDRHADLAVYRPEKGNQQKRQDPFSQRGRLIVRDKCFAQKIRVQMPVIKC